MTFLAPLGTRRTTRLALLASACAVALTCLGAAPSAAQDAVGGSIEYGYWGNARRAELTEGVARAFEAAHPGTSVQSIVAEYYSYIERLTVQVAARELPCVTQMQSTFLATFASRGAFQPLDDLVASGAIDVSGIPPEILETGRTDGELFMIPTGTFLRMVAVNVAMAQEYGIEPPPTKPTYDQYRQWLTGAQAKLPQGVWAAENEGANLFSLYSWVAGHGGTFFADGALAFEPSLLADYFRFWEDLRKAGVAMSADRLDEHFGAQEVTPVARGLAMSGTRDIPLITQNEQVLATANLPAELRFMSNPVIEGVKSSNVPGTNGLSISASCENVPTATSFIDYFANDPDAAVLFQSANGVTISPEGQKALLADEKTPSGVRRSLETLAALVQAGDVASGTYPPGYQSLPALLRRTYEDVALNGRDPAEAADNFFREARRTLR